MRWVLFLISILWTRNQRLRVVKPLAWGHTARVCVCVCVCVYNLPSVLRSFPTKVCIFNLPVYLLENGPSGAFAAYEQLGGHNLGSQAAFSSSDWCCGFMTFWPSCQCFLDLLLQLSFLVPAALSQHSQISAHLWAKPHSPFRLTKAILGFDLEV